MSKPEVRAVPAVRRRRTIRRRTVLLWLVTLVAVAGLGAYYWVATATHRMLRSALADADRLDPGWTLAELEAKRQEVPKGENSADQVARVVERMPANWPPASRGMNGQPGPEDFATRIAETAPDVRLTETLVAESRRELQLRAGALAEARKLADMPRGRARVVYMPNPIDVTLEHAQSTRVVARLLAADAAIRLHDGDADGALASCRAILNAGRSIGDEPFLISQLVRIAIGRVAVHAIERVVAQGEPSEAALAETQAMLAEESRHPALLIALRGERAGMHDLMKKLTTGELDFGTVSRSIGAGGVPNLPFTTAFFEYNHALLISNLNRAVEISRRPEPGSLAAWTAWEESVRPPDRHFIRMAGMVNYMLAPAVSAVAVAQARHRAALGSAQVLIAFERHRIAHGRGPDSIAAIDPRFGSGLPGDPFVGGPLRSRADGGRVAIYAVAIDLKDNGGTFDPKSDGLKPGTDIGLTYFEPSRRRRPPRGELPENVFQSDPKRHAAPPADETEPIP